MASRGQAMNLMLPTRVWTAHWRSLPDVETGRIQEWAKPKWVSHQATSADESDREYLIRGYDILKRRQMGWGRRKKMEGLK